MGGGDGGGGGGDDTSIAVLDAIFDGSLAGVESGQHPADDGGTATTGGDYSRGGIHLAQVCDYIWSLGAE